MKERARVICHMFTTIDGKIDVEFDPTAEYDMVGDEYDRILFSLGEAYGLGRATCQGDDPEDLSRYSGAKAAYVDTAHAYESGTTVCVAFDRRGKLRWDSNVWEYCGHKMPIVEAVTGSVPSGFLAYLNDRGIPYIIAGENDFDPELFLVKLRALCGVKTMVLGGGAQINAEFIKRGLVDEISLVIVPAVDGTRGALTFAGTDDLTGFPQYYHLKDVRRLEHDGLHVVWTK